MRTKIINRVSMFSVVAALLLANFISIFPANQAYAAITDQEEGHQTANSTTFVATESTTKELAWDADLSAYIAERKAEWQAIVADQNIGETYQNAWGALYVAENGVYKYPEYLRTVFTGVSISETCGGSGNNVILVGDVDYLIGSGQIASGCATYNYREEYREINVIKPTEFTVKFDTGTVLPNKYKLVDQTVAAGESIGVITNAEGTSLDDFLDYCYNSSSYKNNCYNGYELDGFYTDPEFNNLYNNNPITENTTLYAKWIDEYEGYERIKEVDLIVTPPEVGTVITLDEDDPWDSQAPQLEVSVTGGTKYRLYDDDGYNYAYWLRGNTLEDYEPFAGVIEKDGKYYVEVWLKIKEGEMAIFDQDFTLRVNGEIVPLVFTDYWSEEVAVMIEVTPKTEEASEVTAPNSGAFTASSSAAPAISSAALISMAILSLALLLNKRKNTK